jgi:hypothetical protein
MVLVEGMSTSHRKADDSGNFPQWSDDQGEQGDTTGFLALSQCANVSPASQHRPVQEGYSES